jgi:Cu(I)/Ag(I) efflux system protein CusF
MAIDDESSFTNLTLKERAMSGHAMFVIIGALCCAGAYGAPAANAPLAATAAPTAGAAEANPRPMSRGEIVKIDAGSAKITIKHGPLLNLNMPPMTMTFKVRDSALLGQLKAGDAIDFVAEQRDGALVVTALEAAP